MAILKWFLMMYAGGFAVMAIGQTSIPPQDTTAQAARQVMYTGAQDKYGFMGLCIGTPAVINVVIGRSWNRWGLRLSGMYLGGLVAGLQGDLVFNFYRRHAFSQSLSIGGGYGVAKNYVVYVSQPQYPGEIPMGGPDHNRWSYAGISYNWNWAGFFLEVGANVLRLNTESIPMYFQIGYVHEGP